MLDKIFGSGARVKILKLFLLHPDKKYYMREIARNLGLQLNSVRRELDNLSSFGLIKTVSKKKEDSKEKEKKESKTEKKYFQVDEDFVLYEEIKALIVKAQILYKNDFVEKIKKIGNLKLFILTGVFVNNPNSSVDVLLVGRVNKDKLLKVIKEMEEALGKDLNFTLMSAEEFKYRKDITDIFLYNILESKKIVIIDQFNNE